MKRVPAGTLFVDSLTRPVDLQSKPRNDQSTFPLRSGYESMGPIQLIKTENTATQTMEKRQLMPTEL